jgi:hypothetical protein
MSLFDDEPTEHDCMRDGPCKTCGATRPAGYAREMFVEPVSGECADCNRATLSEIFRAGQAADREAYDRAWARHYTPRPKRRRP